MRQMQTSGLGSGIRVMPEDRVTPGVMSYLQSLGNVYKQNIAVEKEAIAKFESLIDVSMQGISGRFQEEALGKKDEYLAGVTDIFQESQGKPNARQMVDMKHKKHELEEFAFMYKDLRQVYSKAVQSAMQIKDDRAREQTMKNIADIMENTPSLKDTYDKMYSMGWYVPGRKEVNVHTMRKNILAVGGKLPTDIDTELDKYGNPVFKTTTEGDAKKIEGEIDRTWNRYEQELKDMGFATKEDWKYFVGTGKEIKIQRYRKPQTPTTTEEASLEGFGSQVYDDDMTDSEPVVANEFTTKWTEDGTEQRVPVEGSQITIPTAGGIPLSNKNVVMKSTGKSYNLNAKGKKFYDGFTSDTKVHGIVYCPTYKNELLLDFEKWKTKNDKRLKDVVFRPYIQGLSKYHNSEVPGLWELNEENKGQLKSAYNKKLPGIDNIPMERPYVHEDKTKLSGYDYNY